jgi:hypothetical protein
MTPSHLESVNTICTSEQKEANLKFYKVNAVFTHFMEVRFGLNNKNVRNIQAMQMDFFKK